ncbi:class I SAM-dependent methyltransferase [Salirhabdus salicampi]|uniref:class I SAM-dependent methyltransferase n=1 Tax=Salirhabdus salicampi TaxID=476102 RepID=UPI0020C39B9B|nr:class I SAM-dependent methyltransferase [Salirhabdus salicampi]MCP8615359.1 class I SAM-dependent methyltransferase [Salirhabdus salicampi]
MLTYTGERVIPEQMKPTNGLLLEHLARYYFATYYINGSVLDISCGAGYGSHMMAKAKKKTLSKVVGIDIDSDAIQYAKRTYYHPLVEYKVGNAVDRKLPKNIGQFDTIVSFETFEHVEEETEFMCNIYEMLKPGGRLIISTPFGKGRGKPCGSPFHVHQLTVSEFKDLFNKYNEVTFYGQRGVAIEPLNDNRVKHFPIGIAVCKK